MTNKVAAIYWPTSSVGGINTELRAFRDEADRRGDVFHVLRSGKQKRAVAGVFDGRRTIRGGDTFITIDGEAPHGGEASGRTADWLNANYDSVYLAFLCPHPTKDYGEVPAFLDMLKYLDMPITARITDGYWDTYAEWGRETVKMCKAVTVSQPAFVTPELKKLSKNVVASRFPFSPRKPHDIKLYGKTLQPKRAAKPLTVWTSQWKAIKGIHLLLEHLPKIEHDVELYSNGILYYQLRTSPEWKAAVGTDHFGATTPSGAFSGKGKAPFYGYIPLEDIPTVLSRAWFMIDLMGIGNPKNKVYQQGSFNNTTVEALYYGCCPVLSTQAAKVVPESIALFAQTAEDVPKIVNSKSSHHFALHPKRQKDARKWVEDNFNMAKLYDTAVLGRRK